MSTKQKQNLPEVRFVDSNSAANKPDFFVQITIDTQKILKNWRYSILSHEWLNKDGSIKEIEQLNEAEKAKRQAIESALANGTCLEKPILGIGIHDNVEIGTGRALICTLSLYGVQSIPVHIPKSNEEDFKEFLS